MSLTDTWSPTAVWLYQHTHRMAGFLFYTNCTLNPFLYSLCSERFRKELIRLFKKISIFTLYNRLAVAIKKWQVFAKNSPSTQEVPLNVIYKKNSPEHTEGVVSIFLRDNSLLPSHECSDIWSPKSIIFQYTKYIKTKCSKFKNFQTFKSYFLKEPISRIDCE